MRWMFQRQSPNLPTAIITRSYKSQEIYDFLATSLEEQIIFGTEKSSCVDNEPEDEELAGLPLGALMTCCEYLAASSASS